MCVCVWGGGGEGEGVKRRTGGREIAPTLVVGWRASALKGEKGGRFREVAGMSIVDTDGPRSSVDTFMGLHGSSEAAGRLSLNFVLNMQVR